VIAEADFEQDTITLKMQCSDYEVRAGQHWLHTNQPAAQPAQPAPVTLISSERHIALREAFAINSADLYFEANPTHDNDVGRMLFERGFARGFDSHERAIETAKKGNT
jgi:hypothetical protein